MDERFLFFYKSDDNKPFSTWVLSNFVDGNIIFNCVEQYVMFQKALLFKDYEIAFKVLKTRNPFEQRKLGRLIQNFNVKIWNFNLEDILYKGNKMKFEQNAELKSKLIATKDYTLVHVSPTDVFCGIGLGIDDKNIHDRNEWKGKNILGNVLMEIRDEYICEHGL